MIKKIISSVFGKKNQESIARGTEWMHGGVDNRPSFGEVRTYEWNPAKPVW